MIQEVIKVVNSLIETYDPNFKKCNGLVIRTHANLTRLVEETGNKHGVKASFDSNTQHIEYPEGTPKRLLEPFLEELSVEMLKEYCRLRNDLILMFKTDTSDMQ